MKTADELSKEIYLDIANEKEARRKEALRGAYKKLASLAKEAELVTSLIKSAESGEWSGLVKYATGLSDDIDGDIIHYESTNRVSR